MSLMQKSKKVMGLLLVMLMMVSLMAPVSVFAKLDSDDSGIKQVTHNDSGINAGSIGEAMSNKKGESTYKSGKVRYDGTTLIVNSKGVDYELLTVESNAILINPTAFKEAKQSDVTKAMRLFTEAMVELSDSADAVQQVMQDMQATDPSVSTIMLPLIFDSVQGDMFVAYKITSPFLSILSIVLGVGAVGLIILLMFSTVMDLVYIGLPVWREAKQGKDGSKNPFGVSYEAMRTVEEVEKGIGGGDGEYRNAYLLYFKRRALTYIILAICIMYLICGGLSGIIGFVLQLVSGITG